ncbi:MAG TPA: dTMP kinase [Candidatus Binataceae bacterium]|nr:dTMP kinase [Candidatus Binataceae bacterium]
MEPHKPPHPYPGKLIVVEGIDGSGKSTQLALLHRWLAAQGYRVCFTQWNSSDLVRQAIRRAKRKNLLTPTTFSLLHASDFADRLSYQIMPPLQGGMVVLCDRYIYTAFARDVARGVDPDWVRRIYTLAPRPDLALYFRVPIELALTRILRSRQKLKYYEAGMDLGLAREATQSFRLFQSRVLAQYDGLVEEYGLRVIEAQQEISSQQILVRSLVEEVLRDVRPRKLYERRALLRPRAALSKVREP